VVQLAYAKFLEFPRAVRYLFVGGASIVVQMVTLALLVNLFRLDSNSERFFANAVAFFVSVQFNFAISRTLTWYDRIDGRNRMFSQWAAFNGTNVLILIINQIVFAEVVQFLPYLIASGLAVIIGTVFNYTVSYTLIFRKKSTKRDPTFLQPIFNLHRDFDLTEIYLVLIAFLFIGLASYYYVTHELTLTYADAQSHLMIARRVIDNTSGQTDFAQLGGVWLPLTHIWSLPLVSINELYNTGLAGTYISIFSYFLGAIYTYRLAKTITNHQIAGVAAALIFITNPNILYMASTAMTELPLYFTTTA
jgi:putative flippase GtrA